MTEIYTTIVDDSGREYDVRSKDWDEHEENLGSLRRAIEKLESDKDKNFILDTDNSDEDDNSADGILNANRLLMKI